MTYVQRFFAFWYDFVIGDAWDVAAGVVVALVITGVLAHTGENLARAMGFVLVAAIIGVVGLSLWRE